MVQLVAFVVIGAAATVFGVRYVAGPQSFGGAIGITVRAYAAFGLGPGASVTYRGTPIGEVTGVSLAPPARPGGPGVAITADLDPGTEVPRTATAKVVAASALGIPALDLAADTADGPYLAPGGELLAPRAEQPVPLGRLLADASALLGGVDADAVRSLGRTLGTALDGAGPTLRGILDDTDRISAMLDAHAGQLAGLADAAVPAVDALADASGGFPGAVRAARRAADGLADGSGTLGHLLDEAPAALQKVGALLDGSRADIHGLLAAAGTVGGIAGDRHAALTAGLDAFPATLAQLSSVVNGGRADFVLVGTQGPACYYDTPRRAVGDTSERDAALDLYCPPGEDLEQRGSRNAPRPDGLGLQGATRPGTRIGPDMADDPLLIPTGEAWLRSLRGG